MKILLDSRMINNSGVGTYIRNLLKNYEKSNENIYVYALTNNSVYEISGKKSKIEIVEVKYSTPIYSIREQIVLPYYINKIKPDLVHFPNFNVSYFLKTPFVVTIHDLIYYLHADACPNKIGYLYARVMMKHAARKAKLIITDSMYSKKDIVQNLNVSEEKVHVINPGINKNYLHVENSQNILKKYKLPANYIFYIGNHEPRKNIMGIITAYSKSKYRNDYFLVIGGKKDLRRKDIYNIIENLKLEKRVIFTDYIEEEDLPAIHSAAKLFIFPSFYEGFGLPPLEAMACGTPVISSNASSLPEILGDASIFVNPTNIDELTGAIDNILNNKNLADDLIKKGYEQVKKYSWDTAAIKTIDIYKNALGYIK